MLGKFYKEKLFDLNIFLSHMKYGRKIIENSRQFSLSLHLPTKRNLLKDIVAIVDTLGTHESN